MIASPTAATSLLFIRKRITRFIMENQKVYVHYNHTDSCKAARWTAKESYQFMSARAWEEVLDFYSNVVKGQLSLSQLFGTKICADDDTETKEVSDTVEDKSGRWERVTFKIVLSYNGSSFDGWQKQPGLNTVQELVERSLGIFVDERKAQQLKEKCKPLEGCAVVAGRTDKGVSAIGQVCSFYTWRKDIKPCHIKDAVNNIGPGKLRVLSVSEVSRVFHPNFSAKWRRYLYIFPLNEGENEKQSCQSEKKFENLNSNENHELSNGCGDNIGMKNVENFITSENVGLEGGKKPRNFSIFRVNQLLQQLEGKLLSYRMFARDTKASRSIGPPTDCFMYRARAAEASLPCYDHGERIKVMCVELVANRFLRKMVRVLVATSIREAAAGAEDDALLQLMDATCRRATAPPAPPYGLCLVDVGYTEFNPLNCLIP
ncbi:hypothetical protein SLE2022_272920 [Rubroshorea leprosula]